MKVDKDIPASDVHSGPLHNPHHLVLYPSFTLWGSHSDPWTRTGHYVIENGWTEYEKGYAHQRDGKVWQVKRQDKRGSFCPQHGIDTSAIGICIIGVPACAPPLGALPASGKWFVGGERNVWATERQMMSLFDLCAELCIKFDINPMHRKVQCPAWSDPKQYCSAVYQRNRVSDSGFFKETGETGLTVLIREEIARRIIAVPGLDD